MRGTVSYLLFGLALALLVEADLGLDPWTVFNQGVARHTGLSLGTITVIVSVLLLGVWIRCASGPASPPSPTR